MQLHNIFITSTILGAVVARPLLDATTSTILKTSTGIQLKITTPTTNLGTSAPVTTTTSLPNLGFVVNQIVPVVPQPAAIQYAAAFAKYGHSPPAAVANAAAKARTTTLGSVIKRAATTTKITSITATNGVSSATPEPYDTEYLCLINVGSQNLTMDLDTGSSDLWVFSAELSAGDQAGHTVYNPSKSATSKKLSGQTWSITYGDGGGASGDVYADTIKIGGLTVTAQAVEAAQTISSDFQQDTGNNGMMGLAFNIGNTVSPTQQKTVFDMAIAQGKLAKNLFTANLKKGAPGSYNFGAIDSSLYTGSITYTNVDSSQALWSFTSSGYGVGSATFNGTTFTGIADTGTTLLLLPGSVNTAYYKQVSGAAYDSNYGAYTFPCSASLPALVIGISTSRYTVPGSYMNYQPLNDGSNKCYGGLQSSDGMGINVFGNIFLKAVFVVFDKTTSTPRIGFASKPT